MLATQTYNFLFRISHRPIEKEVTEKQCRKRRLSYTEERRQCNAQAYSDSVPSSHCQMQLPNGLLKTLTSLKRQNTIITVSDCHTLHVEWHHALSEVHAVLQSANVFAK